MSAPTPAQQAQEQVNFEESQPKVSFIALQYLINEIVDSSKTVFADQVDQISAGVSSLSNVEKEDRIEQIGFTLGTKLTDLIVFQHNTRIDFNKMDLLSVMKFICRDIWKQLYHKQIDNLKTNHRGVFYLLDNDFPMVKNFQCDEGDKETVEQCRQYLLFPCGVIRGVLSNLGMESTVTADMTYPATVSFNVTVS